MKLIVAYIAMLIFDAVVFLGTYYGVHNLGWPSGAYVVMTILIICSAPKSYGIKADQ